MDVTGYLERYPVIYIVADRHVAHFAEKVVKSLTGGKADCKCEDPISPELLLLDTSEEDKSMQTVMEICKWLLDNGADRNALLLAIGGGITTDSRHPYIREESGLHISLPRSSRKSMPQSAEKRE